jgi:hypothetical protein
MPGFAEALIRSSSNTRPITGGLSYRMTSTPCPPPSSEWEAGFRMSGLLLAHQSRPVGRIIADLILIWATKEADEWIGKVEFLPL